VTNAPDARSLIPPPKTPAPALSVPPSAPSCLRCRSAVAEGEDFCQAPECQAAKARQGATGKPPVTADIGAVHPQPAYARRGEG
jgi:hypothetical protein